MKMLYRLFGLIHTILFILLPVLLFLTIPFFFMGNATSPTYGAIFANLAAISGFNLALLNITSTLYLLAGIFKYFLYVRSKKKNKNNFEQLLLRGFTGMALAFLVFFIFNLLLSYFGT